MTIVKKKNNKKNPSQLAPVRFDNVIINKIWSGGGKRIFSYAIVYGGVWAKIPTRTRAETGDDRASTAVAAGQKDFGVCSAVYPDGATLGKTPGNCLLKRRRRYLNKILSRVYPSGRLIPFGFGPITSPTGGGRGGTEPTTARRWLIMIDTNVFYYNIIYIRIHAPLIIEIITIGIFRNVITTRARVVRQNIP